MINSPQPRGRSPVESDKKGIGQMQFGIKKVNSALSQRVNSVWGLLIIFRGPSGTRWKNIDFEEFLLSAHGGYHGFAPGLPCCIRQPTKSHHHYQHHHNNYGTNIATIGTSNKCYTHQNIKASTAVFLTDLFSCVNIWIAELLTSNSSESTFLNFLSRSSFFSFCSSRSTRVSFISPFQTKVVNSSKTTSSLFAFWVFFFHWATSLFCSSTSSYASFSWNVSIFKH